MFLKTLRMVPTSSMASDLGHEVVFNTGTYYPMALMRVAMIRRRQSGSFAEVEFQNADSTGICIAGQLCGHIWYLRAGNLFTQSWHRIGILQAGICAYEFD